LTEHVVKPSYQVLLLGKAGSGKGTQAQKLRNDLHIPLFSFEELFKESKVHWLDQISAITN
jgi:adenylate kinase family enzyme